MYRQDHCKKTDDKLYYMQYGFVALYLSFVCVKAGFIFPPTKEYQQSVLRVFYNDTVPPTDVS